MTSRLAVLVAASALVLTGCGQDSSEDAQDPASGEAGTTSTPSGAPTSSSSPEAGGSIGYVALGDSFTAAPLVPETDQGNACLRSSANYPALVAQDDPDLALTDVSCAGADATAMIGVQAIGSDYNPAQFDALSEDTGVVTLGLGGNDFGLFPSLLADCASSGDVNADGSPCTDAAAGGAAEDLTAVLPKIKDRITAVVTGIRDRSPEAQVLVIGYPRLLPDTGSCPQLPVVAGDYDYVRSLETGLNDQLAAAAEASGADFIDVYAASEGHDICSEDPWVNGPQTDPAAALAFHPFAEEQQAVAELILAQLETAGQAGA